MSMSIPWKFKDEEDEALKEAVAIWGILPKRVTELKKRVLEDNVANIIALENEFDTGDLFTNGKNHQGKTPSSDFNVTTPKNPLLSITSSYKYKESYQTIWPISKYQPTVEILSQYPIGLVL